MSIFHFKGDPPSIRLLGIPGAWRVAGFGPELKAEAKLRIEESGRTAEPGPPGAWPPASRYGFLN